MPYLCARYIVCVCVSVYLIVVFAVCIVYAMLNIIFQSIFNDANGGPRARARARSRQR